MKTEKTNARHVQWMFLCKSLLLDIRIELKVISHVNVKHFIALIRLNRIYVKPSRFVTLNTVLLVSSS